MPAGKKTDDILKKYSDLTKNLSNADGKIEAFDKMNESLKKTKEELDAVNDSVYYMQTSLERLNKLQEESVEKTKEANRYAKEHKDEIRLYKQAISEVNRLRKEQKKLQKKGKDLDENQKEELGQLLVIVEELNGVYRKNNIIQKDALNSQIKLQETLNKRQRDGVTSLDDAKESWNVRTKSIRQGFGGIQSAISQMKNALKKTFEPWMKAEGAAMKYARSIGMSRKETQRYLTETTKWAADNNIGILFNKTTDELIAMQNNFSEALGRNVKLTGAQKKDMLAMEKFLGEDGMINMANSLENFGMGMSDAADFVHKTMSEATKSGIAASKLTKTVQENIKMAQNYTFKDGLKGLTSMAKKAIELKTDMSLVNGFITKTSTVEGAISTGANLQVLGGSYAAGSDPLSMMYDALNNVEGLFDRAVGMVQGKVFYNQKSGNFEMGAMDRYMMKQAATQMGIDPEKLIDVAFRKASLDKIESQARGNANIVGDSEMMDLIKNVATWDNGHAVVNVGGKTKKVSELTTDDKSALEASTRTDSENLQDMAINLRSTNEILEGIQKETSNELASKMDAYGQGISNILAENTKLLDTISQFLMWGTIISSSIAILGSILTTVRAIASMGSGLGGMLGRGRGRGRGRGLGRGRGRGGGVKGFGGGILGGGNLAKAAGRGLKVGGAMAAVGAGISIVSDISSGEFKKNPGKSIAKAAGPAIGTVLGTVIGGPIGGFIGGWIGGAITDGIFRAKKEKEEKLKQNVKDAITKEFEVSNYGLSDIFTGENSLQGDYTKEELEVIGRALADSKIDKGEIGLETRKKIVSSGDYQRLLDRNVKILEMGNGGILHGKSHKDGGMPIVGTNIEVEGGEYVVNKESTKRNLPLLENINNNKNDYTITPKEPLGEQMKVHDKSGTESSKMPHNSKINIEPITINLNGTIKLDAGNKQIELNSDLFNNPQFVNKLTEMISKELNILNYGAYNKGQIKQKF